MTCDLCLVTCVLYLPVVIAHHDRIGAINEKNFFLQLVMTFITFGGS